jgi:hypothetical protein
MNVTQIKKWIVGVLILALAFGLYLKYRPKTRSTGDAYAGESSVTVWNTTAQVKQAVATLHWGDKVEILTHSGPQTQVRTTGGVVGWADGKTLLDAAAWQSETHLLTQSRSMPVQAPARTKVFTNLRAEPGRTATRIYQLPGGVPVSILARAVSDVPPPTASGKTAAQTPAASQEDGYKREDWLFVSVTPSNSVSNAGSPAVTAQSGPHDDSAQANQAYLVTGNDPAGQRQTGGPGQVIPPLAGWVLGRFIDVDLPQALRDNATSAGIHPVAWFVLDRVKSPAGDKPQYLVAGTHGGDGQPCDFTLIRVYTWGAHAQHYETAFVESDLCGSFPIRVGKLAGTNEPEFRFSALTETEPAKERVYAMRQTSVRRLREDEQPSPRKSTSPKSH